MNLALEFRTAPIGRFQPHPLLKGVPVLPRESEDFQRMTASIVAQGIIDPLKCIEGPKNTLHVVDGLHRWTIAADQGLDELPYRLVEGHEVPDLVCMSAIRAEWTKSALAYRLWPLFAAQACGHGGNRKSKGNDFPLMTSAEIAEKLRVSEKLVDQAKKVHLLLSKRPKLRAEIEAGILQGKIGLHQVEALISSEALPKEDSQSPSSIKTIEKLFTRSARNFDGWEEWNDADQRKATNAVADAIRRLPKDVQIGVLETLEVAWRP